MLGPLFLTQSLQRFIPDLATLLFVAPLAALYGSLTALAAAWLHTRHGVRAPYTRKIFHFFIITAASLVHLRWGASGVAVYGAVIALLVIGAVARGDGFGFYEAIARPTDAPHRSVFITVPLLTTALGGILTNLLFPDWAHVGYMAVAWGDAVGEPVGTRWGRHPYSVPSLAGVPARRTLEGSAAVFAATALAVLLVLLGDVGGTEAVRAAFVIAAATAGVEAISHHGTDNLTVQLAAAGCAAWLLG